MMCFTITKSVPASVRLKTHYELTLLRISQELTEGMAHSATIVGPLYPSRIFPKLKRIMGGFLCVPRATPSNSTRLLCLSVLFGPPGNFQVSCLHFQQNCFHTFKLWGNRNAPLPRGLPTCPLPRGLPGRGVSTLLFTEMGGGNLAQSSKVTAQGEAKSWKLFVEVGLQFFSPSCVILNII